MNYKSLLRTTKDQAEITSYICGRDYRIKAGYRQPVLDTGYQYLISKFPELKEQIKDNWLKGWEQQHKIILSAFKLV
ncbi:MAG: hypothetical protein LLF98_02310 [Clostridium sp.]|uniref:hypothetical protein n=1 Tax=Clostridium sp. TaxID=1506 RepID=UPI0025BF893A|nr:hypothetical protein [Clostridium sp.]MCE5220115.1 hypothetical protein [Clostridium sp.]